MSVKFFSVNYNHFAFQKREQKKEKQTKTKEGLVWDTFKVAGIFFVK